MTTPRTFLQTVVFIDNAREHACYGENTKPAHDAEWLLFNARQMVRAEAAGDANYVLELARQRQQRIGRTS